MDRRTLFDLKAENNRLGRYNDWLIAQLDAPRGHWLWIAFGLFAVFGVGVLFGSNCVSA